MVDFLKTSEIELILKRVRILTQAIDSLSEGLTIADFRQPDMPLIYANKSFEVLTGYSSSDIIGTNCRFLQGNEDNKEALTQIHNALTFGESAIVTLKNFRKDGSMFYNRLSISPVKDNDNLISHYVGIQHDVTREYEMIQRIKELELALSQK